MKNVDGYEGCFYLYTYIRFILLNGADTIVSDLHFSRRLTQYPEHVPKSGKNICLGYCYYMVQLFILRSW